MRIHTSGSDNVGRAHRHGLLLVLCPWVSGAAQELERRVSFGFFLLTLKATFLDSPPETAGADILETCVYVLGDAEPISEKPRSRRALLRSKFAGSWSLVDIPPWLPYSAILVTEILESAREIIHAPAVPPQLPLPARFNWLALAQQGPSDRLHAASSRQLQITECFHDLHKLHYHHTKRASRPAILPSSNGLNNYSGRAHNLSNLFFYTP